MKIWAVIVYWAYQGGFDTVSVFSDRDKAAQYLKKAMAEGGCYSGDMYDIVECEVDNP